MKRGKRTSRLTGGRRLNVPKIIITIVLIVAAITSVVLLLKKTPEDGKKEKISSTEKITKESIAENVVEVKEKTIDEILNDFGGGEILEQPKPDTYYVSKEGKEYTIYLDGDIVEGKIPVWQGDSVQPQVGADGVLNINNAAELKWVSDQVSSGAKNFAGVTILLNSDIDLGARKVDNKWEGNNWTSIIGFLDEQKQETTDGNTTPDNNTTQDANVTENQTQVENQVTETDQVAETAEDDVKVTNENLKRFAGTFNGNNKTIRGLLINSEERYQGLFGYSVGIIQNVNLKASNINGGSGVGALVGLNGGTITGCNIKNVEVNGKEKVGGFVGISMANSSIESCNIIEQGCFVHGTRYVGGIVGYMNSNATLKYCTNRATVSGEDFTGGISGISFFGSTVTGCYNKSIKITGKQSVGGIIGYSQATVDQCACIDDDGYKGIVQGEKYVGGIVGLNYEMGNVANSYNGQKIKATKDNLGGIVGLNSSAITNSYNTGDVDGSEMDEIKIGGICGQNVSNSQIMLCYNIGNVEYKTDGQGDVGLNFGKLQTIYYLDSCIKENKNMNLENKRSADELKLVASVLGDGYKNDDENKNGGYPILAWQ